MEWGGTASSAVVVRAYSIPHKDSNRAVQQSRLDLLPHSIARLFFVKACAAINPCAVLREDGIVVLDPEAGELVRHGGRHGQVVQSIVVALDRENDCRALHDDSAVGGRCSWKWELKEVGRLPTSTGLGHLAGDQALGIRSRIEKKGRRRGGRRGVDRRCSRPMS